MKLTLALDMYSKAIQEDSLFTAAYAQRAKTHLYIFWNKHEGWQGHDLLAKEDIKKGLQLNPESPEMRFAEAVAYYQLDRNYDKSLKILTELKAEAPNMADLYAYSSYILRRQGKLEESISELNEQYNWIHLMRIISIIYHRHINFYTNMIIKLNAPDKDYH